MGLEGLCTNGPKDPVAQSVLVVLLRAERAARHVAQNRRLLAVSKIILQTQQNMSMCSQTARAKARAQRHLSRSAGVADVILPMPTIGIRHGRVLNKR